MKKLFLYFLSIVIFILVIIIFLNDDFIEEDEFEPIRQNIDNMNISCYNQASTSESLPNIDAKLDNQDTDWNIFFHETSCFDENGLALNARQACAVESAAKINPDMNIYLLFLSPSKISRRFRRLFKQLQTYPNIHIRRIKPEDYMKNTPLNEWYKTEILKKSKWPINHMSDILRYLTLWKYGGIYLDLDVIVIKPIKYLANFAGAEDRNQVAAGVIGFDTSMTGRRMANECIQEIRNNFRGDLWNHNGPGVITRILKKICSTKNIH
ncbi:lactosylceramide 4-alpha-galactosyltransferase isoform X4 [Apis mellifera]|uniref:Lactosylceramide 4-alpha-galactosyltransferase isoform X4 n=1 Tax=Apis mellifera TaxID=7460 RepID=A0A7M7MQX8_APIME|nr:lactosylceramide 4-alpha-galactosyltransferase isoform X4 [Apis mellifera]|eukprot:XP_026299591.1 lactosylceramide 4-alpha-galactosyltransferase isoform X4 [Apis mellifera]